MKELNLEEIKRESLNILLEFHKICVENNINYSLGGGSLLGAVRHKGFIPWDDDIDIMMLRSDYEKFLDIVINNDLKIKVLCGKNHKDYSLLFGKVYNPNTLYVRDNKSMKKFNIGLYIDVFPIDYLDNDYNKAIDKMKEIIKIKDILFMKQYVKFHKSFVRKNKEIYSVFAFLYSRFVKRDILTNKIQSYLFDKKTDFVVNLQGNYGLKEVLKASYFDEYIDMDFEGHKLKVIKDYDDYLTQHYGNYMELPPVEKRVTHHHFKVYYK